MSLGDAIGIAVLVIAYGLTWVLLLRSLKIVNIIDKEKLKHARQIRTRLKAGNSNFKAEE
jgi:hypothetical protein